MYLLDSQIFKSPEDEIKYLRELLEKERNEARAREDQLTKELEFALRSAEKISQECDHAVLLSCKLKAIAEGTAQITDKGFETQLINEISEMRHKNQKINHMNQKYREDLSITRRELLELKKELSRMFEDILVGIKTVPQYAAPIIHISHSVDTSNTMTVMNGLRQANQFLIQSLQTNTLPK